MDFSHLYALDTWNFQSSLLKKCWCHFQAMLNMQLHSCSNLAHIHGYNTDNGSFKELCANVFTSIVLSLFFIFYFFFVSPSLLH